MPSLLDKLLKSKEELALITALENKAKELNSNARELGDFLHRVIFPAKGRPKDALDLLTFLHGRKIDPEELVIGTRASENIDRFFDQGLLAKMDSVFDFTSNTLTKDQVAFLASHLHAAKIANDDRKQLFYSIFLYNISRYDAKHITTLSEQGIDYNQLRQISDPIIYNNRELGNQMLDVAAQIISDLDKQAAEEAAEKARIAAEEAAQKAAEEAEEVAQKAAQKAAEVAEKARLDVEEVAQRAAEKAREAEEQIRLNAERALAAAERARKRDEAYPEQIDWVDATKQKATEWFNRNKTNDASIEPSNIETPEPNIVPTSLQDRTSEFFNNVRDKLTGNNSLEPNIPPPSESVSDIIAQIKPQIEPSKTLPFSVPILLNPPIPSKPETPSLPQIDSDFLISKPISDTTPVLQARDVSGDQLSTLTPPSQTISDLESTSTTVSNIIDKVSPKISANDLPSEILPTAPPIESAPIIATDATETLYDKVKEIVPDWIQSEDISFDNKSILLTGGFAALFGLVVSGYLGTKLFRLIYNKYLKRTESVLKRLYGIDSILGLNIIEILYDSWENESIQREFKGNKRNYNIRLYKKYIAVFEVLKTIQLTYKARLLKDIEIGMFESHFIHTLNNFKLRNQNVNLLLPKMLRRKYTFQEFVKVIS